MLKTFKALDKDGDGYMVASEMRELMRSMGHTNLSDQEVQDLIGQADLNGDGKVDYTEFATLASKGAGTRVYPGEEREKGE